MSTQERTWRENAWIRFLHRWWIFPAQGAFLLILLKWGSGAYLFILQCLTMALFCLDLAWISLKGIGCKPNKVSAFVFVSFAIPLALIAGFAGFLCAYSYLFET